MMKYQYLIPTLALFCLFILSNCGGGNSNSGPTNNNGDAVSNPPDVDPSQTEIFNNWVRMQVVEAESLNKPIPVEELNFNTEAVEGIENASSFEDLF